MLQDIYKANCGNNDIVINNKKNRSNETWKAKINLNLVCSQLFDQGKEQM